MKKIREIYQNIAWGSVVIAYSLLANSAIAAALDQPLQQGYTHAFATVKWATAFGFLGAIVGLVIGRIAWAVTMFACVVFAALCLGHLSAIFSAIGLQGVGI